MLIVGYIRVNFIDLTVLKKMQLPKTLFIRFSSQFEETPLLICFPDAHLILGQKTHF
jgi:hypothetical protein